MSGCSVLSKSGSAPTATPVPTQKVSPSEQATALPAENINIVESGDTITITGGTGENIQADRNISLNKADYYIVNVTYGGVPTSLCLLKIGDRDVPNTVGDWGGNASIFYQVGTFYDGEYPVIVKEAHGPWTMVIQKNPKAGQLVTDEVNCSAGFCVSQPFHLNKGKATFKFTRNTLVEHYAAGIHLVLSSMDTGKQTDYLWWNAGDASHEYTVNIPADGSYVISGSCMSDWEATISQ